MSQPASRPPTYVDLLALPDDVRAEILNGQIVALPAPRPRHSKPQGALGHFIGGPYDDDDGFGGPGHPPQAVPVELAGGWWIFMEIDIQLGANVVRPDLSGWRRARLPEPDVRPITVVPDWVCEIVSERYEARDRATKKHLYAEHAIAHYWLVDPQARTLEASSLGNGRWFEAGSFDETALAHIPPFEAVELPIGRLFLPRTDTSDLE